MCCIDICLCVCRERERECTEEIWSERERDGGAEGGANREIDGADVCVYIWGGCIYSWGRKGMEEREICPSICGKLPKMPINCLLLSPPQNHRKLLSMGTVKNGQV